MHPPLNGSLPPHHPEYSFQSLNLNKRDLAQKSRRIKASPPAHARNASPPVHARTARATVHAKNARNQKTIRTNRSAIAINLTNLRHALSRSETFMKIRLRLPLPTPTKTHAQLDPQLLPSQKPLSAEAPSLIMASLSEDPLLTQSLCLFETQLPTQLLQPLPDSLGIVQYLEKHNLLSTGQLLVLGEHTNVPLVKNFAID